MPHVSLLFLVVVPGESGCQFSPKNLARPRRKCKQYAAINQTQHTPKFYARQPFCTSRLCLWATPTPADILSPLLPASRYSTRYCTSVQSASNTPHCHRIEIKTLTTKPTLVLFVCLVIIKKQRSKRRRKATFYSSSQQC